MKLQACTKCGAQFDISPYSPGQQFTCGACGEVLTAGGAAPAPAGKPAARRTPGRTPGSAAGRTPGSSRTPAAPARGGAPKRPAPGRTPGKRVPGAGKAGAGKAVSGGPAAPSRGPQYQPVQRAGQAPAGKKAAPPSRRTARAAGGDDEGEPRGRRGARPAAGPNKGLLIGAGVVVVLIVVLLIAMGGGKKDDTDGAGGGTDVADNGGGAKKDAPPEPTESAQDVMGEYGIARPTMLKQYRGFINRLKAIGDDDSKNALRRVYEDFIEGPGRDDKEARTFLGYKEFAYEIPEDISFRDFDYLKGVTEAYKKHWFGPDEQEEYEIALRAKAKTEEHMDRLINDHRFRAGVGIRANIAKDKWFKDYNYAARWADPYLICYASTERLSEFDLLSIKDKAERRDKMRALKKKREEFEKVLDEKALIFTQLYKEFYSRYKDSLNLKPLMDEYGGRADYPIGVRSYQDGVPLVIWIFDSVKAFREYHSKVKKEMIPHNVAGYFSPQTSYVYLYDEADNPGNRVFEINKNVHEGTHQLEYWFTRQRNRWRKPRPGQDWFGEGIAEFVGSVKMDPAGQLEFTGVNVPRLQNMQGLAARAKSQGREYNLFPVDKLCGFQSYGQVQAWGANTWQLDPGLVLSMFYQQSWAFTYFLNNYKNGKYKERFDKFFDLVLHRETGGRMGSKAFQEAFRIRDEDDWADINDEFHDYLRNHIMKMKASDYQYTPPARGSLGGSSDNK